MDFQHRTTLVTGAGAGIGRAIATAFVQAGARVMANDIDGARIEETAALLRSIAGDRIASYVADVRSKSEVDAMVAETTRRFGPRPGVSQQYKDILVKMVPWGRMGKPD